MKKIFLTLILLLVIVTSTFASSGETLMIGGAVPLILELTVSPTSEADNLPLIGITDPKTVVIADVVISTNNSVGWELYISSVNGAELENADGDVIGYTLTYSGLGTTGATAPTTGTPGTEVLYGEDGTDAGDTAQISITYAQSNTYPAGYYSDHLTVLLRAK